MSPVEMPHPNLTLRSSPEYADALIGLALLMGSTSLRLNRTETVRNESSSRLAREVFGFRNDPNGLRGWVFAETLLEAGRLTQRIRYEFYRRGLWIIDIDPEFLQQQDIYAGFTSDEEYLAAYLGVLKLIGYITEFAKEAFEPY